MHQESKRGSARGGRGRGRGAGRGKRGRRVVSSDEDITPEPVTVNEPATTSVEDAAAAEPVQPMETSVEPDQSAVQVESTPIDIESDLADISQLEAPTFTTISRGPPEPMLRLKWTHKVLLIGEKVLNPMIHSCDTCLLPILHYGRMIPCKHVFCLMCAKREPVKECPRCKDKVCRVEQSGLGSVFMCTHGGSRYNNMGCRRTYLSHRDLQAHINHRHVTIPARPAAGESVAIEKTTTTPLGRKSIVGNTTPTSNAQNSVSSVRSNLLNMQENINDGDGNHFPRHSTASWVGGNNSGGLNWSNNYR